MKIPFGLVQRTEIAGQRKGWNVEADRIDAREDISKSHCSLTCGWMSSMPRPGEWISKLGGKELGWPRVLVR